MRVLVDCCLQEKVFNKYYTVLASKLCEHEKNHKFTLQVNYSLLFSLLYIHLVDRTSIRLQNYTHLTMSHFIITVLLVGSLQRTGNDAAYQVDEPCKIRR